MFGPFDRFFPVLGVDPEKEIEKKPKEDLLPPEIEKKD